MPVPVTHYAKSGDVHVAYQIFGSGPTDLVFVPGFVSHIENYWEHPDLARWLLRLGSFARVIMFDKRGTGLSDPVPEVHHWTCAWMMSVPSWMPSGSSAPRNSAFLKARH
jgi:pimeloyl-ACP methyl ester carboxylesterase